MMDPAVLAYLTSRREEELNQAFQALDPTQAGSVSAHTIRRFFIAVHPTKKRKTIEKIISNATDSSGKITNENGMKLIRFGKID